MRLKFISINILVAGLSLLLPHSVFAVAATDLDCTGCVGTRDIANVSVTNAKLGNNAVNAAKISDGSIINADINATAGIDPTKISGTAWTATNDGLGTGLDADLLDGIDSSLFLRNDMSGTLAGSLSMAGSVGIGGASLVKALNIAAGSNDAIYITSDASDDWYVGPNVVALGFGIYDVTQSASRFHIDMTGNVGIGIASPSNNLDLVSTGNTKMLIHANDAVNDRFPELELEAGNSEAGAYSIIKFSKTAGSTTEKLEIQNGSGTSVITVKGDGKVGIGTIDPNDALSVYMPYAGDVDTRISLANDYVNMGMVGRSNSYGQYRLGLVDATGGETISLYAGSVGIGTITPSQKLDVQGNIYASGSICNGSGACVGDSTSSSGISGSGSSNSLAKWTGGTSVGNSLVEDDGATTAISTAADTINPAANSTLTLGAVGSGSEGAELKFRGGGTNPYFYLDNYGGSLRMVAENAGSETTRMSVSTDGKMDIDAVDGHWAIDATSDTTGDGEGAISGVSTAPSGNTFAIYGESNSTGDSTGSSIGVYGLSDSNTVGSAGNFGVAGYTTSTDDQGTSTTTTSDDGSSAAGVWGGAPGNNDNTSGSHNGLANGVQGETWSQNNEAAGGRFFANTGSSGTADAVYAETDRDSASSYSFEGHGPSATTGSKSAIVYTDQQGSTQLYAEESAEIWFSDYGEGQLINGKTHITLDPLFAETITVDENHPMQVFLQLYDNLGSNQLYVQRQQNSFDVIESNNGSSNAHFAYKVLAKRKYYEEKRLLPTQVSIDQFMRPDLTVEGLKALNERWGLSYSDLSKHSAPTKATTQD